MRNFSFPLSLSPFWKFISLHFVFPFSRVHGWKKMKNRNSFFFHWLWNVFMQIVLFRFLFSQSFIFGMTFCFALSSGIVWSWVAKGVCFVQQQKKSERKKWWTEPLFSAGNGTDKISNLKSFFQRETMLRFIKTLRALAKLFSQTFSTTILTSFRKQFSLHRHLKFTKITFQLARMFLLPLLLCFFHRKG